MEETICEKNEKKEHCFCSDNWIGNKVCCWCGKEEGHGPYKIPKISFTQKEYIFVPMPYPVPQYPTPADPYPSWHPVPWLPTYTPHIGNGSWIPNDVGGYTWEVGLRTTT